MKIYWGGGEKYANLQVLTVSNLQYHQSPLDGMHVSDVLKRSYTALYCNKPNGFFLWIWNEMQDIIAKTSLSLTSIVLK